jgi:polar amino acid transport system substrate-binding protein
VAYSDIYFRGGEVLVVRAGGPKVEVLADLKGQAVGVELGSSAETIARQSERRFGYRVQSYESLDAAANALETGEVRALLTDAVSARLLRRTKAGLTIAEQAVGDEPNYVVAMPIDAPELLAALNRQLRAMDRDGALKTLLDKWF